MIGISIFFTRHCFVGFEAMPELRDTEDEIHTLCDRLLSEQDQAKAVELARMLRAALHTFIEETRTKVALMAPREMLAKHKAGDTLQENAIRVRRPKAATLS